MSSWAPQVRSSGSPSGRVVCSTRLPGGVRGRPHTAPAWSSPAGGRVGGSVGAVEAHDGVEVHQPAALVLRDLRERQPPVLRPVAGADAEGGGQGAAQVGGEPRPQRARRGPATAPRRRSRSDVGVEGGADPRVVGVVAVPAAARAGRSRVG